MANVEQRVARFGELDVLDAQKASPLPQEALDLIYSRKLMPVLTRASTAPNPFGTQAPIMGAGDIAITYASCPVGTGPTFHAHRRTYETFTVLSGRFVFALYKDGEEDVRSVELGAFDVISVLPGWYRAFRCVGPDDGLLQVIITGGEHDIDDIYFPASTAQALANIGSECLDHLRGQGLHFDGV
jgi:mannose-6-phosphate isomerase-like protein (cupin superfamily)